MEQPARDSLFRPRLVTSLAGVAALFALGFALSAQPQQASAGGLPLPTITLPGVTTVTLPTVTTPTTTAESTTGATTAVPAAPPAPGSPGGTATTHATTTTAVTTTPAPVRTTSAQVTGAKKLRSGAISIPISSVRAPARLRVVLKFVRSAHAASVRAQVIDSRGFLVRGARVSMRSAPVRAIFAAKAKRSAENGTAMFPVRPRKPARLRTIVVLTFRAIDPAAPALASASSRLRLAIRGGS